MTSLTRRPGTDLRAQVAVIAPGTVGSTCLHGDAVDRKGALVMKIHQSFRSTILQLDSGTAIVKWADSVAFFGSTKSVKVKGTIDGIPFHTAFMPWGDGTQFLPLNKTLLKALGKQPGDEVEVTLEESIPPGSSQKVK